MFLTSVADHTHGWRREDEDASAEKSQFPQYHDLLPEETDEVGHAAGRVGDLLQMYPSEEICITEEQIII